MHTHTHAHTRAHTHSSYMILIGVHEMHDLLVVDLRSSLAYFMMTHPLPIAGKLPIKSLVARQLPTHTSAYTNTHTRAHTNVHTHTHTHIHMHTYTYINFACICAQGMITT